MSNDLIAYHRVRTRKQAHGGQGVKRNLDPVSFPQVNIESLETRLAPAPITGTPLFEMEIILSVPAKTPISKMREELGKLCDEINIDWQLAAV